MRYCLILAALLLTAQVTHAEPRTGGVYDRPMLVRPGIDDLGITVGKFLACTEETLSNAVRHAGRDPSLSNRVEVKSSDQSMRLTAAGQSGPIHLRIDLTPEAALVTSVILRGKVYRSTKVKMQVVLMLPDRRSERFGHPVGPLITMGCADNPPRGASPTG